VLEPQGVISVSACTSSAGGAASARPMSSPPAARGRAPLLVVLTLALVLLGAVVAPAPAQAHETWVHGTVVGCQCHFIALDDIACTSSCHPGLASVPGQKCWSCHAPGTDTSAFSSSDEACAQECHLFERTDDSWGYVTPSQHETVPHLGAEPEYGGCLACHALGAPTGTSFESAHHSGLTLEQPTCARCHDGVLSSKQGDHGPYECLACHTEMDRPDVPANCVPCHLDTPLPSTGQSCLECHAEHVHTGDVGTCRACHPEYRRHADAAVDCTRCHRGMALYHHGYEVSAARVCRECHPRGHDGTRIAGSKCLVCHTGRTPVADPSGQHSRDVNKLYRCRACHLKTVHAKATHPRYTCRTCHRTSMHALQKRPTNATCLRCHPTAVYHTGWFKCVLCHRRAVHDRTP